MKRSRSISLVLMGSIAFGGVGCSNESAEDSFTAYESLQQCVDDRIFSEQECRDMAISALLQSPQFSSKEECERAFGPGECGNTPESLIQAQAANEPNNTQVVEQRSQGSWMPMMLGFMAGRYLSQGMYGAQPLYRDTSAGADKAGNARTYRTAGGEKVSADAKGRMNPTQQMKQSMQHKAKPAMSRGSRSSSGGFSGNKAGGMGS